MAGIYDILAGMGGPPAPYQPRPDRALYGEAFSQGRDVYGPLVMDAFEREDQARFAAMRGAMDAGGGLAMALANMGPVGAPYGVAAGQVAGNAEALGRRAYAEGTTVGGDVAARLAGAGQDPGVGAALQQIGQRSQGVINALGAGGVENLLSKEAAATGYGNAIGQLALSGFRAQAEQAGRTPSYANARNLAGQEADAIQQSYLKARELEMQQQADSEKQQQDTREFIMQTALRALGDQPSPLDLAKFDQSVLENQQDQDYRAATLAASADAEAYQRQQDALDRQADTQDTVTQAEKDRRKRRASAMETRDSSLSTLETAAASVAARLAKGYKVEETYSEYGREKKRTVTKQYSWQEAMKRAVQELMAKYKTDLGRSGIKNQRVLKIVRQALLAAQFSPPSRAPIRPGIT